MKTQSKNNNISRLFLHFNNCQLSIVHCQFLFLTFEQDIYNGG